MKKIILTIVACGLLVTSVYAAPPRKKVKSKFYDFNEQLIDGQIRTPTGTYTNARERVQFARLLKLKKSFLSKLFATSKERTFK